MLEKERRAVSRVNIDVCRAEMTEILDVSGGGFGNALWPVPPPPPFARFAFYSQRPIVACSMKQMHIGRVLFRRVPSDVRRYVELCLCAEGNGLACSLYLHIKVEEHSHPSSRSSRGKMNLLNEILLRKERVRNKYSSFSNFSKFRVENVVREIEQ